MCVNRQGFENPIGLGGVTQITMDAIINSSTNELYLIHLNMLYSILKGLFFRINVCLFDILMEMLVDFFSDYRCLYFGKIISVSHFCLKTNSSYRRY